MLGESGTEVLWKELRKLHGENLWAILDTDARGSLECDRLAIDLFDLNLVPTRAIAKKIVATAQQRMRDTGFSEASRIVRESFLAAILELPHDSLSVSGCVQLMEQHPARDTSSPNRDTNMPIDRPWFEMSPHDMAVQYAKDGPGMDSHRKGRTRKNRHNLLDSLSASPRHHAEPQNSFSTVRGASRPMNRQMRTNGRVRGLPLSQSERAFRPGQRIRGEATQRSGLELGQAFDSLERAEREGGIAMRHFSEARTKFQEEWDAAVQARQGAEAEWQAAMQARREAQAVVAAQQEEARSIVEQTQEPESELPAEEPDVEAAPNVIENDSATSRARPLSRGRKASAPRCYKEWQNKRQDRAADFGQGRKFKPANIPPWLTNTNAIEGFSHMAFANSLRSDGIDLALDGEEQPVRRRPRSASPRIAHPHYASSTAASRQKTSDESPSGVAPGPHSAGTTESDWLAHTTLAKTLRGGDQRQVLRDNMSERNVQQHPMLRRPKSVTFKNSASGGTLGNATALRAKERVPRTDSSPSLRNVGTQRNAFSTDFSDLRSGDGKRVLLTSTMHS